MATVKEKAAETINQPGTETNPQAGPTEIIQRKRGRPRKDPNAEQIPGKEYKFKAGLFLISFGANANVVHRTVDNSQAVTLIEINDEAVLMWERGDQIALFKDSQTCDRNPHKLIELLKDMGIGI